MCVIILTTPKHPITEHELKEAWDTNPDGGGYAYVSNGRIHFRRGFMSFEGFKDAVMNLQSKYELLLHLRISTGAGINRQGTHPYKVGNVLKMKGRTELPVIAMNGVIAGQELETRKGMTLNDTASYIQDHDQAFKVINADILNIIAEHTGSKWAAVTTEGIIHSQDFQEHEGRLYSNLNHLYYNWVSCYTPITKQSVPIDCLVDTPVLHELYDHWDLYDAVDEYIENHCNYKDCKYCNMCLTECKNLQDIKDFLKKNQYIWEKLYLNGELEGF